MTVGRLLAVGLIYCCTAVAWSALGGSIVARTGESDQRLAQEVAQLWGGRHNQIAPDAWYERPREVTEDVQEKDAQGVMKSRRVTKTVTDRIPIPLDSTRMQADFGLDPRRKGLLWYDTYRVSFRGDYRFRNPQGIAQFVFVRFCFPSTQAIYDAFVLRVDGHDAPLVSDLSQGVTVRSLVPPQGEARVEVAYHSRGLGDWTYSFGSSGVAQVRDFQGTLTTDFVSIDFPAGTLSPTSKSREGPGWKLSWRFESLVTGQELGLDPPNRLNPGPLASRITFFAPVSLLFFLTVMVILGLLKERSLHPMHYFFIAAAFFAFHLLLAYLVDHVNVHAAFAIASAASVFLVVSYLRLVGGMRFALLQAGLAQLIFLVLFSYAFFFEGYTGLTVTVGAVLTLFVLMQLTGGLDWAQVFSQRANTAAAPTASRTRDPLTSGS